MKKSGFAWYEAKTYYEEPIQYLEIYLQYKSLNEMSKEIGLSINTLQKMRKGEKVTGKSWSKLRIWYLGTDLSKIR